MKVSFDTSVTLENACEILYVSGCHFEGFLFDFLYNLVYLIDFFLSVISASKRSRAIVSGDDNTQSSGNHNMSSSKVASQSKNALPFKPLTFTFLDVCYFVQTPQVD